MTHHTNTTADRALREAVAQQNARPLWVDCQGEGAKSSSLRLPIDILNEATGNVGVLSDRMHSLAAKLVGDVPLEALAKGAPCRPGTLGAMADRADNIQHAVASMNAALDRIEAQLP